MENIENNNRTREFKKCNKCAISSIVTGSFLVAIGMFAVGNSIINIDQKDIKNKDFYSNYIFQMVKANFGFLSIISGIMIINTGIKKLRFNNKETVPNPNNINFNKLS